MKKASPREALIFEFQKNLFKKLQKRCGSKKSLKKNPEKFLGKL